MGEGVQELQNETRRIFLSVPKTVLDIRGRETLRPKRWRASSGCYGSPPYTTSSLLLSPIPMVAACEGKPQPKGKPSKIGNDDDKKDFVPNIERDSRRGSEKNDWFTRNAQVARTTRFGRSLALPPLGWIHALAFIDLFSPNPPCPPCEPLLSAML
jgi:hypothetical protein